VKPAAPNPRQADGEALGRRLITEGWTEWTGTPFSESTSFQATFNALQLVLAGSADELKAVSALGAVFGCIVRDGVTPGAQEAFARGFRSAVTADEPVTH